jgi:Mrp family chromosome partitioning ATPase
MSVIYDLLKQLEESSRGDGQLVPSKQEEERPSAKLRPLSEEPFYRLRANSTEIPLRQVPRPRTATNTDDEIVVLVESLATSQKVSDLRSIVFCEIEDYGASSLVCASAGRALAARSELVCLVDTNVRQKTLSRHLGIDPDDSPTSESGLIKDCCIHLEENLWLAGPSLIANANDRLLPIDEIADVMARLASSFDYVLVDTQSTSVSRDAAVFGRLADGAVLVVEAGITRKQAALRAKELLQAAGVPLIGTILNNRTYPIPKSLYKRL